MHISRLIHQRFNCVCALLTLPAALVACNGPNLAAVDNHLREENMRLEGEVGTLKQQLNDANTSIKSLQANIPTVPTLPPDRIAQLFTIDHIEIRGTTDTWDNGDGKGITGFRVYVRMADGGGQSIPAAGTISIEAFELPPSPAVPKRIGQWTFTPGDLKKNWYSGFGLDQFALYCPWNSPPTDADVTFKVSFTELLTNRAFESQLNKHVSLPSK